MEGRLEEIQEEHIDNDVYDVEHEVGNDDHSNVIDLSHISKCFKNGSDPYLNPCDSDDETESTCSSPSVAPRVINDRSGSSRDVDVFGDKFLRAVLLNTFVEHIKERGITGCRKSQINARSVLFHNSILHAIKINFIFCSVSYCTVLFNFTIELFLVQDIASFNNLMLLAGRPFCTK